MGNCEQKKEDHTHSKETSESKFFCLKMKKDYLKIEGKNKYFEAGRAEIINNIVYNQITPCEERNENNNPNSNNMTEIINKNGDFNKENQEQKIELEKNKSIEQQNKNLENNFKKLQEDNKNLKKANNNLNINLNSYKTQLNQYSNLKKQLETKYNTNLETIKATYIQNTETRDNVM